MYRTKALLSLAVILFIASASIASNIIYYVDANSPNAPGSGTYAEPFRRIQDAIDIAADGNIVEIQPGLYTGPGNFNLDPSGKSITIRSVDPNAAANTIIDPNKAGRGFIFQNGEDANCIISGLTIRNAQVTIGDNGAGIYCFNSSPIIHNCIIQDSHALVSGGGIFFDHSNATAINCTIMGNIADFEGGGIESVMSDLNILNCVIIDNNAPFGGGITCYSPGTANLVNCTIVANSALFAGGAVFCWSEGNVVIKNSILWANSASEGTQLGLEEEGQASVIYCDVQGGQTGVYDPYEHLVWGQGNMDSDPCFASFDLEGDPAAWDFHLKSVYGRWNSTFHRIDLNNDGIINLVEFTRLADVWLLQGTMPEDLDNSGTVDWMDMKLFAQYFLATNQKDGWITDSNTSLCIDSGDPNSDWSIEPWPNGKRINMGAYGGTFQASKNGNPADFNIDHLVNFVDFAQMANQWLTEQMGIEDLIKDGKIDFADIAVFAENWLWEKK